MGKTKGKKKQYSISEFCCLFLSNVKAIWWLLFDSVLSTLAFDEQKKIFSNTIEIQKEFKTTKSIKEAELFRKWRFNKSEALVYNAEASLVTLDVQIQMLENTISLLMGEPSHEIERTSSVHTKFCANTDVGYPSALWRIVPDVKTGRI